MNAGILKLKVRPPSITLLAMLIPLHAVLYSIGTLLRLPDEHEMRFIFSTWAIIGTLLALLTGTGLWMLKRWALVMLTVWLISHNAFLIASTHWDYYMLIATCVFVALALSFPSRWKPTQDDHTL